jgi:hypothetical protein
MMACLSLFLFKIIIGYKYENTFILIYNVEQSDMNLSMLALLCSRIPLVQGGVYCLPYGEWALHFFVK